MKLRKALSRKWCERTSLVSALSREFDRSRRRARAYASSTDTGELLALDVETGSFHEGACPGGRIGRPSRSLDTRAINHALLANDRCLSPSPRLSNSLLSSTRFDSCLTNTRFRTIYILVKINKNGSSIYENCIILLCYNLEFW